MFLGLLTALMAVFAYLTLPAPVDRRRLRNVTVLTLFIGVFFGTLAVRNAYRGPSLRAFILGSQAALIAIALRQLWSAVTRRPRRRGRHAIDYPSPTSRSRFLWGVQASALIGAALAVPAVVRYAAIASCDTHAFPEATGHNPSDSHTMSFPLSKQYAGPLSIIIAPEPGASAGRYAVLLRWGEWRHCSVRTIGATALVLESLKNDGPAPPLRVATWPPATMRVVEGRIGQAPVDINMTWVTWPEWLIA